MKGNIGGFVSSFSATLMTVALLVCIGCGGAPLAVQSGGPLRAVYQLSWDAPAPPTGRVTVRLSRPAVVRVAVNGQLVSAGETPTDEIFVADVPAGQVEMQITGVGTATVTPQLQTITVWANQTATVLAQVEYPAPAPDISGGIIGGVLGLGALGGLIYFIVWAADQ